MDWIYIALDGGGLWWCLFDVYTFLLQGIQTLKDLSYNRMEVETGASFIVLEEDAWCTLKCNFSKIVTLYGNKKWLEGAVRLLKVVGRIEAGKKVPQ